MFKKFQGFFEKFRYSDQEQPLLEHLDDLRKTVIRSALALVAGMLICLPFADRLILFLRQPAESLIQQGLIRLQFAEPAAAVKMWLSVSFFGGLLLSLPLLVFFIGSFVMPGVREVERKALFRISLFSGALFLLGLFMGYAITLPFALDWMVRIAGRLGGEPIWLYNRYTSFAVHLLLGFGLAFQLPVVLLILGKMGLIKSIQLREKRRHAVIGLLVLAMFLTPPDVSTQLLMAVPLILLYECCIWILYFTENRTERAGSSKPANEDTEKKAEEPNEE